MEPAGTGHRQRLLRLHCRLSRCRCRAGADVARSEAGGTHSRETLRPEENRKAMDGKQPERGMNVVQLLLIIVLVLLILAFLPGWSYSAGFGYAPSGLLLVIL